MVKIRKYTLKKKHKNRFTGGSDNNRNLNRRERRKLSRTLPKLQAVIRRRISNNSPSPSADSTVLPEPPMIIPQTSPITVPQTSPITVPRTYPTTRRRRGWRSQRGTPILWYNLSPEQYLRQTQHYIPILQPIPMPASNIPATEPVPIDSDGNEIINVNDESNNEYILSIDRKGNVTVLKDGSSPIEGGGKSSSRHSPTPTSHPNISIDGLINIFLHFCNKYEYHSVGLWRNRNVIGHEYDNDIRKDVFRLSDALNDYNESVDDSNQYSINSYMDESLELIPISFKTLFVDNHDDVGSYYSTIALLDFDLNTVGVDRNGNIVNLLEYAETYLKREIEIRDELVEVIRNNNEENINPNVRHWIETANDEIIDYEWKIDVLRALYAIKDAKFKESKRQRESSNYKLANIPDDISNELAKFQFGGAPVSPDNKFFYSMINNDLEGMRKAIESGANVNIQYHHGTSPLIFLAESEEKDIEENIEMVDLLLTNNANPNLQDKHGNTALHWAAARGYLKFVEKLIEKKAETNIQNLSGFNPLHSILEDEVDSLTFYPDNVEPIMKLLIQNGINVNHKDWNENTPLHLATENNNSLAIGILLRAGANENIRNYNGKTPHEIALENINGGRFEVEPEQDALPSIEAFGAKALRAFADFRREKAQAYLAGRAQANRRDATYLAQGTRDKGSILHSLPNDLEGKIRKMMFGGAWTSNAVWSALLYGHSPNEEKFKLAIESGADVNEQNHRGDTPLICLSSGYRMNIEMVDLLLTNNADPNLQDEDGETALHWAAFKGYLIVVERLLESKNIDINITNEYGGNALHSIFKDEESGTGNYGSYSERCFDNVEPIVKLLIEKGININETDDDGKTPLHLAAEQNHGGAVGILLRAGADENIKTDEVYWRNGQTAYELAENIRNMIELQRDASVRAMFDDDAAASDDDDSTSIDADRRHYIYVKRNCPWYGVIDVLQKTSLSSDNEYSLWAYEPLALNAFHQFHREKAQAYLAEEAKNEDSYLNSLPDELEEGIRNMFGGRNYDNDLLDAAASKNLEQMRIAIESGANVNVTNHRSISPLISLAKSWGWLNIEMVDLLLTNNADPNLQDRGGETALHWAAARGYLEMVKKLLESENIDINITNIDDRNALHSILEDEVDSLTFYPDNVEPIMKLLIEKGININETDNSGKTALHLASEQNNGNAVGILLRAGADENIKTDDYHPAGQTAYELAKNKKNRIELDRHNSLGEIIPGGDLVERLRITQIERDLVRAVMTVGEEEHSFQIPRDILVDTDHNLWTYEPLALNAFHEFHREKAQAYLAGRAQANRRQGAYLAQGTRDKGSILHSLPNDLEGKIRKMMFGGGQIFSSNKKDYELEFLNNELSKTRKRYNTYGKLLAVNQLIPKNVDNDIWDFAMKCYNIYKKNYVPHEHAPASAAPPLHSDRHATMIQTMVRGTLVRGKLETERLFFDKMLSENANQPVILIDWMQTWIDEDTLELIENTMRFIWNRRAGAWPEPAIIGNSNTTDILRSFKKAFSINSTPEIVLIVYLKVLAFIIEYNYLGLTLDDVGVEGKEVAIKRLDAIFESIYNKENYELSLHKVNFENPFISHIDTREMTEIIDYITFYKEIAIESLTTIYELFEKHDNVFEYLLEQVKKNDKIDKEQDQKKMYKLRKRRVNMWGKHYRHPINRLPEDIEAKIDENLL